MTCIPSTHLYEIIVGGTGDHGFLLRDLHPRVGAINHFNISWYPNNSALTLFVLGKQPQLRNFFNIRVYAHATILEYTHHIQEQKNILMIQCAVQQNTKSTQIVYKNNTKHLWFSGLFNKTSICVHYIQSKTIHYWFNRLVNKPTVCVHPYWFNLTKIVLVKLHLCILVYYLHENQNR